MKAGLSLAVLALIGEVTSIELKYLNRPQDEFCDGDEMDGRDLEDEGDPDDMIVDDDGFVRQWDSTQREISTLTMLDGTIRMFAETKPSDEVANGDKDDDRQLEDSGDPNDPIVDDTGFVRQWDSQMREKGKGARLPGEFKYIGLGVRPSDEVANGDESENKELEDENDPADMITDDNGFVNQWKVQLKNKKHIKHEMNLQIDYLMNQHNRFKALSQIQNLQIDAENMKYSDELCNGDADDDRDIHEDEDMNDDVVDVNGHTNAGYGSLKPTTFFDQNHILDGHMITVPREEGPLRNNVAQN